MGYNLCSHGPMPSTHVWLQSRQWTPLPLGCLVFLPLLSIKSAKFFGFLLFGHFDGCPVSPNHLSIFLHSDREWTNESPIHYLGDADACPSRTRAVVPAHSFHGGSGDPHWPLAYGKSSWNPDSCLVGKITEVMPLVGLTVRSLKYRIS